MNTGIELHEMFAGRSFAPAPGSAPGEITVNVDDISGADNYEC